MFFLISGENRENFFVALSFQKRRRIILSGKPPTPYFLRKNHKKYRNP